MKYLILLLLLSLHYNYETPQIAHPLKIEKISSPTHPYEKMISLLKEAGYDREVILKQESSENNIFSYNGKVNSKGIRLTDTSSNNSWVEIIIYQYEEREIATEIAEEIVGNEILDIIFKDYNVLYHHENHLLLLSSGCNISDEKWKEIKSIMIKEIGLKEILSCNCGGKCRPVMQTGVNEGTNR